MNDTNREQPTSWRTWTLTKLATLGVFAGASFVLFGAASVFLVNYYANRPKPWNTGALTVQWTDVKYLTGQNDQVKGFLFQYGVKNNTNRDYELRKDKITLMSTLSARKNSLIPADFNYSVGRESFFLPAHQTSLVELYFEGECGQPDPWAVVSETPVPKTAGSGRREPDLHGLLADPQFNGLDKASQKQVLGRIDPRYRNAPAQVLSDPGFQALQAVEQLKIMRAIDPTFAALPEPEQNAVLSKSRPASKTQQSDERVGQCFNQYTKDVATIVLFDQESKYQISLPKPQRTSW